MIGQSTAILRNLRISPRKVRLCVDLIRGMRAEEALLQLDFMKKHAATPIATLLRSAIANAVHNHKLNPKTLVVTEACVNNGPTLYRWMPRAQGRATPIRKRTSHITLVVAGEVGVVSAEDAVHSDTDGHDHGTEEATEEKAAKGAKTRQRTAKKVAPKPTTAGAVRKTTVRKAGRKK